MSQNEKKFQNKNNKTGGKRTLTLHNREEGGSGRDKRPSEGRSYARKPDGERKSYGRPASGDRKPYAKRDGDGERRPYSPRSSDGEKRPYARKTEGGEGRSYARKPDGERKSYGRPASGERRPYVKRDGDGERRPYSPRSSDGEKRPYAKRDGERSSYPSRRPADGERRPYAKRDGAPSGEKRSYTRKPDGERKSYGKSFDGEKRSYARRSEGDRKPYARKTEGDRKPYARRAEGGAERRSYAKRDSTPRSYSSRDRETIRKPREENFDTIIENTDDAFVAEALGEVKDIRGYKTKKEPFHGKGTSYKKKEKAPHNQTSEYGNTSPEYLYGFHSVTNALLNPNRTNKRLFCTEGARKTLEDTLNALVEKGLNLPEIIETDKDEISKMLPKDSVHQGIMLDCEPLDETFLSDVIINAKDNAKIIILDKVTDPHNVGAIMRSGAALGAIAVVAQKIHSPEITGVLAKSACGAVECIPFVKETNLNQAILKLKEAGFTIVGLDERGTRTIAEAKFSGKVALVLGAEGDGIRQSVTESCDELVKLPTHQPIASLNVSNAAAVALYELVRGE